MSGLAGCFHRHGGAASAADLGAMAVHLAWRGRDGHAFAAAGPFALGNWHFWTTPEEVGEIGPRKDEASGLLLAFDGRLDNRDEIARALDLEAALGSLSDADLVLRAWLAFGEGALGHLLGPFALIVADPRHRTLWLARDPTGHRGLAFHLGAELLLAASDESAIAADPRVGRELDEAMVALYFSLEERTGGRTFFRRIEQILPGELLRVTPERAERRLFYQPQPECAIRRPEEWQEIFLHTLREATRCRLRSRGPVGILLSGGLDSTPIAALARQARPAGTLHSFTWTFERHPSCDERAYVAETVARYALEAHQIPCDDAGPLAFAGKEGRDWPVHPGTPEQNAYRLFHQRSYAAAQAAGVPVLLSGMGGDQLYSGADSFAAEYLREGRFALLTRELLWHWRQSKLRLGAFRDLVPASLVWRRRRRRRAHNAPWLTAQALALLPQDPPWPPWASRARRPEQVMRLFDPTNAHGINVEWYYSLRLGVATRYPWRDRRILELFLQLPIDQLRFRDEKRPILRQALRFYLPPKVAERALKTSFEPVFRQSLFEEHRMLVSALLDHPNAAWPGFVAKRFLENARLRVSSPLDALMIWMCVAFELWLRRSDKALDPSPLDL